MSNPLWPELRELSRIRLLAFLRSPEAVFWVFAFPLVLAAVLGWAFQSGGPPSSRVGLVRGISSEEVDLLLEQREGLERVHFDTREDAERSLLAGRVDLLVLAGRPPELRLDPVRAEAALARARVELALAGGGPTVSVQPVLEAGSRYVDFLFPGLLGMNLMGTGLWSIGFAVAEARQRKILKRMLVTPMRRSSFLASFLLSRLAFLAAEVVLLTGFGALVLGVPLRSSLALFALLNVVGAACFAAVGLLSASRVRTIEGASGMLNLVMMPMWLGSGVFFSYERFPEVVHPLLRALPLTALNDALRAAMLEGAGVAELLPELGVLAVWTVLPFALALRLFRWS